MSRLHERIDRGHVGWQWDAGPVFVGEDGRKWAIQYGRATRYLEELAQLAEMKHRHEDCTTSIHALKAMQEMEERLDVKNTG